MSGSAAPSARPAGAAIAWATKDAIYVEIPCRTGPPYVARYHRTAEGLAAALNIICDKPEAKPRTIVADHPAIRRPKPVFDEADREKVREVLRGLKLV